MSVVAQRFVYGTLLLGATLFVLWIDKVTHSAIGFFLLTLGFGAAGWLEFLRLVDQRDKGLRWFGLAFITGALALDWLFSWFVLHKSGHPELMAPLPFLVAALFPGLLLVASFRELPTRNRIQDIAAAALGIGYILFPLICALHLRHKGIEWAVLLILLVKGNDIGAYLVGRFFGRRHFTDISPKKTLEGCAGGLVLGIVVTVCFAFFVRRADPLFGPVAAIFIGLGTGIAAQIGDLAESYLKRSCSVKDSASLVPAFGGTLDMLDSILFGAPVLYFISAFCTGV